MRERTVHVAIPQAAISFVVATVMAAYVGLRREKTSLHWHLMALLVSLMT